MSRVGPHAFRIGSRNDGSFIVSCTTMSRWSVFQRSYPSERGRRRERDLHPLQRRGVPFSFAGAKVRRLFQTAKSFDNFFAKFFPQGDLCQRTRARTFNIIRERAQSFNFDTESKCGGISTLKVNAEEMRRKLTQ